MPASTRTFAPRWRRSASNGAPALTAVLGHGDLSTSLLLVFPLFLAYEIGVVFSPAQNGVDFVTRNVFALAGHSFRNYLLINGGLALGYIGVLVWLRRRHALRPRRFLPVLIESGVYALTLGSMILYVMRNLLRMDPSCAVFGPGAIQVPASVQGAAVSTVLSLGAGVHEELVFRLWLLVGVALLARVAGAAHGPAVVAAFVLSSAAFSAAHHLGPAGDPWALGVFTYRLLAGLAFAALFYFRSLAHAVYTHAFYDMYVMLVS